MKNEKLIEVIEELKQEALETLVRWVRQPSARDVSSPQAPFGTDLVNMQQLALEDMKRLGFAAGEVPGYASFCDLGEGDVSEGIGILGHIDVVPVGKGWNYPPYEAVIEDGKLFGRGSSDDKGPMVASLYAMEAVKRLGIPLKRRVRLIVGCDEETGVESIIEYKKQQIMPKRGFSPDAEYPVINIEKGGCHVKLTGRLPEEGIRVISFNTGERPNVIPGEAEAVIEGNEELRDRLLYRSRQLGFETNVTLENGLLHILTIGKGGHAAMGEGARNAIGQMLLLLSDLGVGGGVHELARFVGMTYHGEELGIAVEDAASGKLTCSMDMIRTDPDEGTIGVLLDIRYPVMMNVEAMMKVIQSTVDGYLTAECISSRPPHYVSPNSRLVGELMNVYNDFTGEKAKPLAIGGGTYAGSMEEGVAFGALFPSDEDMAHQPDEYIRISRFYDNIYMIADAIIRLASE